MKKLATATVAGSVFAMVMSAAPANADCNQGIGCSNAAQRAFIAAAHRLGIPGGSSDVIGYLPLPNGQMSPIRAQRYADLSQEDSNIVYGGATLCGTSYNPFNPDQFAKYMGLSPSPAQVQALTDAAKSTIC